MANEKRLIDVEKLMENAKWYEGFSAELDSEISLHYISVADLKSAPTVDAVEVVHGEWEIIEDDYFDLVELKCSACGESLVLRTMKIVSHRIITTAPTAAHG